MNQSITLRLLLIILSVFALPGQATESDLPDWAICTVEELQDVSTAQGWAPIRIGDALAYSYETIEALPYLPNGHWRYAINGSSEGTLAWGGPVLVAELGVDKHEDAATRQLYVTRLYLNRGQAFRRRSYFEADQELDTLDIQQIESFECGIDPVLWVPGAIVLIGLVAVITRLVFKRRSRRAQAIAPAVT